ncbi:hypothetical protein LX16_2538 [Stackebrandtia albiflava]|uniref:Uncharacterized protein n=1 Tax=Stackebrandtia albiflava TaxID=406432 RepID=A0A562V1W4_9ACTN|nr:hypothetical protein [Stackebrandtia albiflava]TWJ11802.1 hypothetical protein LX16_2538 [Stackebrandtia albiflava]
MPTSVLLAVLAGAGLLALAPALVRRYDADERIAADREESQARVLDRTEKGHTGTGATPADPPAAETGEADPDTDVQDPATPDPAARRWERSGARVAGSVTLSPDAPATTGREEVTVTSAQLRTWWQRRHRRVLYVLLALVLIELVGVVVVGPGFWLGVGVSLALLLLFVRFLRQRAVRLAGERARRPRTAERRSVYVPPQPELTPAEDDDSTPDGLVPGFDSEEPAEPEPPVRRRTGGIRGRSYESPANL